MFKTHIPLIDAAAAGDLEAVQTLIAQGTDLEVNDDCGRTPLHAIFSLMQTGAGKWFLEKMACARALLSAGADPKALDKWGHDVMHHAVSRHCSELVRTLRDSGLKILPSYTLLQLIDLWPRTFSSVREECEDILRMMLEEQPDLNQRADEKLQRTALLLACSRGHHTVIEILLSAGADPGCTDSVGSGPLVYLTNFAQRSQTDCWFTIYLLIKFGADVNNLGHGPEEDTALGWLTKYGGNHMYMVALLLESGADPNLPNNRGETPLIHAARSDRPDLLQTLLMFGADPNVKDHKGITALDHAKKENRQEAVQVLEKNSGEAQSRAVQVMENTFRLRHINGA
jgi:ankyrin repeat protein